MQPIENYNEWRMVYFIAFLLLVGFFVLNMFVGVVVENFHKCKDALEAEMKEKELKKRLERKLKKKTSKQQLIEEKKKKSKNLLPFGARICVGYISFNSNMNYFSAGIE